MKSCGPSRRHSPPASPHSASDPATAWRHSWPKVAIWRLGAVHVPLFTAFAPRAIAMRLVGSAAKVVVTDPTQRPKLEPSTGAAAPAYRIVVAGAEDGTLAPSDVDFEAVLRTPVIAD